MSAPTQRKSNSRAAIIEQERSSFINRNKRLKLSDDDAAAAGRGNRDDIADKNIVSVLQLPEDAFALVLSFCDIAELLALRNTSRSMRGNVGKNVLEQRALKQLTVNCRVLDRGEKYGRLRLQPGWSDEYSTEAGLVQRSERFASQHILFEYDYDREKALHLLQRRGLLKLDDFSFNWEKHRRRQRARGEDCSDDAQQQVTSASWYTDAFTGWDLRLHFARVNLNTAMCNAKRGISELLETAPKGERAALHVILVQVRQCLCALLMNAFPSAVYGRMKMSLHHEDYPSGDKEEALMFRASTGQKYELFFYNGFQYTLSPKIR